MPRPTLSRPRAGLDWQRALGALFDVMVEGFRQVFTHEVVDGVLLEDVKLSFNGSAPLDTAVEHSLGREPKGWQLAGKSDSFDVWTSSAPNKLPRTHLLLSHNANQSGSRPPTVTLWVF